MPLRLRQRTFGADELAIMAIVNRTPDSFYDRGATYRLGAALVAVDRAVSAGAAIVDIGGVKAGPGPEVDPAEERRRTVELVAAVRSRYPELVISVDTWGGPASGLAEAAAEAGAGLVCAHAGGLAPRSRPHRVAYPDLMADIVGTLTRLADRALAAGVRRDGILLDPAHDFGKNTRHSLEVTRRLGELTTLGFPVLVSLSRKDFLGETLDLPVHERLEGTLAATAVCAWLGASVFRAHDVQATRRVLDTVAAIRGSRPPAVARRGLA